MVASDDPANRVQPQAGTLADAFGGEERFEDVRLNLGGNSRAGVAHLHEHAIEFSSCPQAQFTLSLHGFNGVIHQVGPDLVELTAVGADARQGLVIVAHYFDPALEAVAQY